MTTKKSLVLFLVLIFVFCPTLLAAELDLSFYELEYREIFRVLGESQGLNVLVDPAVLGTGSFQLKGVSFAEALDLIARHSGYSYSLQGNTLLVAGGDKLVEGEAEEVRLVHTKSVAADEVLAALALLMPRNDVYVQPGGGLVILSGSKDVLDQAEKLVLTLDNSFGQEVSAKAGGISLLEIFQDLSEELSLNLVADPALEGTKIFLTIRQQNPQEVIKQVQELVPLKVEITEHSLVVGPLSDLPQERLQVYQLDYAEPEAAKEALSMFIREDKIKVDEKGKSVIVRGSEAELVEVDLFLIDFDQPAPQVLLEVWVQEMSSDAMQNLGIDWQGTPSFSGGDAPVFMELEWEPWDLVLALRALEDQGEAKLLANPKVATLSGQEAKIFVGDKVPLVLSTKDEGQSVEYIEAGINLRVTPRISADKNITIEVRPEVSTFIWKSNTEYPQIRTREAETIVRVKNGQPIVIGGLLQEEETELITKIPFLSQLPVLGKLFQWREIKKNQTEMTIFLIPRIVEGEQGLVNQGFFTKAQ